VPAAVQSPARERRRGRRPPARRRRPRGLAHAARESAACSGACGRRVAPRRARAGRGRPGGGAMSCLRRIISALSLAGALSLSAALVGADQSPPESYSVLPRGDLHILGEVLHANTLEFAGLAFRDVVAKPLFENDTLSFSNCRATAY